ncbi:hypothetical protein CORC01_03968 [Colletotrichum orchidophilum]|uniref:Uncharacterized protein n=1 Tax=Colletotrichum orchidophilum TaxID=1209926 RepID=A0A1G4BGX7_9PEZI|nr:uncharacterized protein CORC01_03968 [Colletotrichum orchidophilum]OHF00651.1 hypothetical protein CORC01_03968 [Colletotrichum orchidophilum]
MSVPGHLGVGVVVLDAGEALLDEFGRHAHGHGKIGRGIGSGPADAVGINEVDLVALWNVNAGAATVGIGGGSDRYCDGNQPERGGSREWDHDMMAGVEVGSWKQFDTQTREGGAPDAHRFIWLGHKCQARCPQPASRRSICARQRRDVLKEQDPLFRVPRCSFELVRSLTPRDPVPRTRSPSGIHVANLAADGIG